MQNNFSRAAKYGDGLFETIRVSNRNILFVQSHYERLSKGLEVLALNKKPLTIQAFTNIIKQTIAEKSDTNLRVRITFFRSEGGLYTPQKHTFEYFTEVSSLSAATFQLNQKGLQVGISSKVRLSTDDLSNLKTTAALPYVLAGIEKKAQGWDDCLLLNYRENVAESIAANVFIYKNNTLFTPALSEGCIAGVMRKNILSIAKKNKLHTQEKAITLEELENAEAIFLTNAIQGIQWIRSIHDNNKKSYYTRDKCPNIVALLTEELNRLVLS